MDVYICGYCTLHKPCKPCHVPHPSRITAWGTVFTKIFFVCPRSWSHAFLITNLKTSTKKILTVCPESWTSKKKIKDWNGNSKAFRANKSK